LEYSFDKIAHMSVDERLLRKRVARAREPA
jgi:hypothetical protein